MHVVIVGAGEVGWFLAERLGNEHHDVVVIEIDPAAANMIAEQLDVQVVIGSGSSPSALVEAGIGKADLLAAVTQNDEVNMIASLLGRENGVTNTVVRLQSGELRTDIAANLMDAIGADLVIDPDADTADEILELIHASGADEVYPMAAGSLLVIGCEITKDAEVAGRTLAQIGEDHGAGREFIFGAVTRDGVTTFPRGDHRLEPGDHVRMLVTKEARHQALELLGHPGGLARRVMILGGGAIGFRVADHLQREGVEVIVVERDHARAADIAERLRRCVVVRGEITDTDLLSEESIGRMDVVVAATGEDSSNVLACAYAAAEGAPFTAAVLHSLSLLPLVRRFGINAALSPRTASANAVLRYIRGGTTAVTTFLETDAEVDELEIEAGSPADGVAVSDLVLPTDLVIGALIQPGRPALIVSGRTVLNAGDHIVVFARPGALAKAQSSFGA